MSAVEASGADETDNNDEARVEQETASSHTGNGSNTNTDMTLTNQEVLHNIQGPAAGSNVVDQMDLSSLFQLVENSAVTLLQDEMNKAVRHLSQGEPQPEEDSMEAGDEMQENHGKEGALKITLYILRTMDQKDLADKLEKSELRLACHRRLRIFLKKNLGCWLNGKPINGISALFKQFYTDLCLTYTGHGRTSLQHSAKDCTVSFNSIFNPLMGPTPRTVMTTGVTGIGKSISVKKCILEWIEGKANGNIDLIFPFSFHDLNLMADKECSLFELLENFLPEIRLFWPVDLTSYNIVFILDGLESCQLPLDFQHNGSCFDVMEPASVDVLLTNLIKGTLLPSLQLWITSHPAAAARIPPDCVQQVTEITGFGNAQKLEFFRKRFSEQTLASKVWPHFKRSSSFHFMCHLPVFCWVSATVLQNCCSLGGQGKMPLTLTQMYSRFFEQLLSRIESSTDRELDRELFVKLGRLAFNNLQKDNLIFSEENLLECYISTSDVLRYPEVIKQDCVMQRTVYIFAHHSFQQYLGSVYVVSHRNSVLDLLKTTVDQVLQSKNGHMDLYLRFLLGFLMHPDLILLGKQGFPLNTEASVLYLREKAVENFPAERIINLLFCLDELEDKSLHKVIQRYFSSGHVLEKDLSSAQWSAMTFMLAKSEEELEVFELKKYMGSDVALVSLLPLVKRSRKALLSHCSLTEHSCEALATALSSTTSTLSELDLSENELCDSGVKLLSVGLENQYCKLVKLRLSDCKVTDVGCASLASALALNPCYLKVLDLSNNHPGDTGMGVLCSLMRSVNCNLEKLRLSLCGITDGGFALLASVLSCSSSRLRELDLSYNSLSYSAVRVLSAGLESPNCKLEKLQLILCGLTEGSCASLASALHANPSYVRELDLSCNHLGDKGLEFLSAVLGDPRCKLERLRLARCRVMEEGCEALVLALHKNPSHLRELELSNNLTGSSAVEQLNLLLHDPKYQLQKLEI